MKFFLNLFFCLVFSLTVMAQKDSVRSKPAPEALKKLLEQVLNQNQVKSKEIDIEIDGLLVDDTKTRNGKDFYDHFYQDWQAPREAKNFSIVVSEKPFRLISTLIAVTINDNLVYQAILQPRQDIIEGLAGEAILYAQDYLINYEAITRELNGEDMSGSGIF